MVSENLANAQSTGTTPGSDPYRRKTISFVSELDRTSGSSTVAVNSIDRDPSDFPVEFQPGTRPPTTRATSRCPTSTCSSKWPT